MKHKRTKATDIPMAVKWRVWERDNHLCILCHRPGNPWCHFIPRSQGGLGIEQNVITLCNDCHEMLDNGKDTKTLRAIVEAYLREHYENWNKEDLVYNKWR